MILPWLTQVIIDLGVPATLVFIMITVGMDLSPADFRLVFRYPKAVIAGLAAPVLLLPLIAGLLILIVQPPVYIAIGMIVLAACPGGALSNFYTSLARADVALSVTLTALSTLLSLITLPLIIVSCTRWLLNSETGLQVPVTPVMGQLLLLVMLPVIIGMLLRYRWPDLCRRYRPLLQRISTLIILLQVGMLVYDHIAMLIESASVMFVCVLLFIGLALVSGYATGRLSGLPADQRFALTIEFSVRNMAVAVMVAVTILGHTEFILFGTLFFVIEVPIILLIIALFRYLRPRSAAIDNHPEVTVPTSG